TPPTSTPTDLRRGKREEKYPVIGRKPLFNRSSRLTWRSGPAMSMVTGLSARLAHFLYRFRRPFCTGSTRKLPQCPLRKMAFRELQLIGRNVSPMNFFFLTVLRGGFAVNPP